MYVSAHTEEEITVVSKHGLPGELKEISNGKAIKEGNFIYLPEDFELSDYKRMCLTKLVEMEESSSLDLDNFQEKDVASTLYQMLEEQRCSSLAAEKYPRVFVERNETSLSEAFTEASKKLSEKKAKKLLKKAVRYQQLIGLGRATTKTAAQFTKVLYKLLKKGKKNSEKSMLDFLPKFNFLKLAGGTGLRCKLTDEMLSEYSAVEGDMSESEIEEIIEKHAWHGLDKLNYDTVKNRIRKDLKLSESEKVIEYDPSKNPHQDQRLFFKVKYAIGESGYDNIIAQHGDLIAKLKNNLGMMVPESRRRLRKQRQGDNLDLEAAIDYMTQVRQGKLPDDNVYMDTIRKERDVYVGLLLDFSSSMRGYKISMLREATAVLSEVFDDLGDTFSVVGYSGFYPEVRISIVKEVNEKFDHTVRNRIAGIREDYHNRDGAAIRFMTDYMLTTPHKTNVLMVLSDGRPEDHHYGNNIKDTRSALLEAKSHGLHPYCVTLDSHCENYIEELYSGVSFSIVESLNELPDTAGKFYKKIAF